MAKKNIRTVITGIGPISSIGIGKESFWGGLIQKKINIQLKKSFIDKELWEKFYAHTIDTFNILDYQIDVDKFNEMREWKEDEDIPDLNFLIASIKLALDDSGLKYGFSENKLGLVLAHENLGLMPFGFKISNLAYELLREKNKNYLSKKDFFDEFYHLFIKSGYDLQTFANLFHIAKLFNIHNYSLFINNACASGLYAIEVANQIIKNNQARAVVVAASDYSDVYKYLWFKELGIYSKDGIIKPFSKKSSGIVFGDGGIALVIEELQHALNREATIYAEYIGGGFNLEGWKITLPRIGSDSYQKSILNAMQQAQIEKDEIDLLCPHGIGSQVIDYYESKAITDIFGLNPQRPFITTYKPYFGHNLGGSSLMETAVLLLSIKNNLILPTINHEPTHPKFKISLLNEKKRFNINIAMKICCAFAGYNAASIFKKFT